MILFLDFDGVLHPADVYLVGKEPVLRAPGALYMYADLLVEALAERPDVRIVLSTNWVPWLGFDYAKANLPAKLQERVIGATWHSKSDVPKRYWLSFTRAYQISTYVDRHHLTDWFAIDDDAEGWPASRRENLIYCGDDQAGLSDPEVLRDLARKLGVR